jgi:uridylate kinase
MLATMMNGLAIQSSLEKSGIKTKIQSSLNIDPKVAEVYIKENCQKYLSNGKVVIFIGGTGRPYFTTDTAAVLIATEIKADAILMGKNGIDGIYDLDPNKNSNAKKFDEISWDEIIERKLAVMDSTAASLARENNIKLYVFNISVNNSILKLIDGVIPHTKVLR